MQAPFPKNRYLSFDPGNAGELTAIRVKYNILMNPFPMESRIRWVGYPKEYDENSHGDPKYKASLLGCAPVFRDWGDIAMLHVYGEEVQPESEYEIQVIHEDCQGSKDDEYSYSAPLKINTAKWGDIVEPMYPGTVATQPDITDLMNVVDQWLHGDEGKTRTQIEPQLLDPKLHVGMASILRAADAWLGAGYPYSLSCPCLSITPCSTSTACTSDAGCSGSEECLSGYCTTTQDECERCIPPSP
jgi:hypothetical protein